MEEKITPNISELSNEEAWLILLLFYVENEYQNYELWDQFRRELIYNNRFHSEHPIVEEIQKNSKEATRFVKAGTMFYRARKFNSEGYRERVIDFILKAIGKSKADIDKTKTDIPSYLRELLIVPDLFGNAGDDSDNRKLALKEAWEKWKKNIKFKGFNSKESTAPPASITPDGRANPENIRYLYLCEDKETPIYEMRPIIGQNYSIAKFKLKRDVKIYDLTQNRESSIDEERNGTSLFKLIGTMFSIPNDGKKSDYIPTQFIAEKIKRMGFDGIRFDSSLHQGGINIVLFDPDDCTAVSSDLVEVSEIKIFTNPPEIYDIGNHL